MYPNLYADVQAFNRAVLPGMVDRTEHGPSAPDDDSRYLGAKLVLEEVAELMQALGVHFSVGYGNKGEGVFITDEWLAKEGHEVDVVGAVDAIADIFYVVLGVALRLGVDEAAFNRVWAEVTRANMAKAGGPLRADGKRLKPEGWTPPDIAGALNG
jgi:predicted HAD superfamily Cof-like phosphohydrolase